MLKYESRFRDDAWPGLLDHHQVQLVPVQTIRIAQYIKEVVATRQRPRPEVGQNPSPLCINLL